MWPQHSWYQVGIFQFAVFFAQKNKSLLVFLQTVLKGYRGGIVIQRGNFGQI